MLTCPNCSQPSAPSDLRCTVCGTSFLGEIAATLDRDKLRRAVTPQVFKVEVLKKAFETTDLSESVTDECLLVEKLGHPIAIVEGNSRNIKLTHPEDLILAEALMKDV